MNTNTNWNEQEIVQEFRRIVSHSFPQIGALLNQCHLKVIQSFCGQHSPQFLPYIAIYCPKDIIGVIKAEIYVFREVAFFLGLSKVVCLNATCLLHDPQSKLKQENPQLWLELQWIVTQEKGSVP
ncbi:MAG: hypothetical protein KME46_28235 [Brasilonema angustatum HA4187-MV1]|jgi:hypothetical protein|nr:hypothetical protein [Brasilonema angustatum HA4187-MV1]